MLSFRQLQEKKTKITINPKKNDCMEEMENDGLGKNHGDDCDCMKCEKQRRKSKKKDPEIANESAVPGKPAERLGAVTAIPKDERDAARERTLAKAKAARAAREKGMKEDLEIEEGLDMKTFKANRKKAKAAAERADAVKRGHVGKEWYNSGRRYSPDEARRGRANMDDEERRTRHRSAVDPDNEDDNNYSADRTKNPKKQRKQAAMGETTPTNKKEGYAYDNQEEVSKESNQGIAEKETNFLTFGQFTEQARNPYAIGMATAMDQTGDNPPLKKSTIKKAHKIAKKIEATEEVEHLDELNRVEKETGINTKTNRPTQTGGAKDDKAFTSVKRMMRGMEGKPAGQRKKVPGKKPPKAGEYGGPLSPAQKIAKRRAAAARSKEMMHSRYD